MHRVVIHKRFLGLSLLPCLSPWPVLIRGVRAHDATVKFRLEPRRATVEPGGDRAPEADVESARRARGWIHVVDVIRVFRGDGYWAPS